MYSSAHDMCLHKEKISMIITSNFERKKVFLDFGRKTILPRGVSVCVTRCECEIFTNTTWTPRHICYTKHDKSAVIQQSKL